MPGEVAKVYAKHYFDRDHNETPHAFDNLVHVLDELSGGGGVIVAPIAEQEVRCW